MDDIIQALAACTGYEFKDGQLARLALTHSSYAKAHWAGGRDNERLEFLGDAVLELAVSRVLYDRFPGMREGDMSFSRQRLVREESLYAAAVEIGLEKLLFLDSGEEKIGGRNKPSIVSDAFEAVIAAICLDGGYEEAAAFIGRTVLKDIREADLLRKKDAKTELQETAVKKKLGAVLYELTGESGPDHDKTFAVRVLIGGEEYGRGEGASKKAAEQQAAGEALAKIGR